MAAKPKTSDKGEKVLKEIRKIKPFIEGSMTVTRKKCGNPKCRCATLGPIHQTALLTWKEGAKTRTIYVPIEMREEVRNWVEEGKRLKKLIKQMSREQREFMTRMKKKKGE